MDLKVYIYAEFIEYFDGIIKFVRSSSKVVEKLGDDREMRGTEAYMEYPVFRDSPVDETESFAVP